MALPHYALEELENTSRTFFIPISRLPATLQEAVGATYLCMRAIDEIEDHPELNNLSKMEILRTLSVLLQARTDDFSLAFQPCQADLPKVTRNLGKWVLLAPDSIAPRIIDAVAAMADRMAYWAAGGWRIRQQSDLDCYTFGVAGAVGLLLSDLWAWYNGTSTNRRYAIGFGRGLQAVNMLRNRSEDLARGVNFYPDGWDDEAMQVYARQNLALADLYNRSLPPGPILHFCRVPLSLAYATLDLLAQGGLKLSRSTVLQLVAVLTTENG